MKYLLYLTFGIGLMGFWGGIALKALEISPVLVRATWGKVLLVPWYPFLAMLGFSIFLIILDAIFSSKSQE